MGSTPKGYTMQWQYQEAQNRGECRKGANGARGAWERDAQSSGEELLQLWLQL